MKVLKSPAVKILISIALLSILFLKSDREALLSGLGMILENPIYIPLILFLFVMNYVVSSLRWKSLLIYDNSEKVSVRYLSGLYFIGAFFNNFMPTSIGGDVYKVYKLGEKINSNANAFSATFMERFTGMMALVFISYLGLIQTLDFWTGQLPAWISGNGFYTLVFKFLLFFGFWIAVLAGFLSLKFLSRKIGVLKKIYDSLVLYRNDKRVLLYAFLTSFLVQLIAVMTQYLVFRSIGVGIPLFYALLVFPVIFLVSFFVPSLNGLGVQDFLYIQFFGFIGVDRAIAFSASIIYHLFRLVISLFGGILYATGKAD